MIRRRVTQRRCDACRKRRSRLWFCDGCRQAICAVCIVTCYDRPDAYSHVSRCRGCVQGPDPVNDGRPREDLISQRELDLMAAEEAGRA